MKSLEALRQDSLQNMEYVTLMRETLADVEATKVELLTTDVPLQNYLGKVKNGIDPFEKMTKNPLKDPLTEIVAQKDFIRSKRTRQFRKKLYYYELSENPEELAAFETLEPVWLAHRNILSKNVKGQTGETDNLLNDLSKEPFVSALGTLNLTTDRDGMQLANDEVREVETGKRTKTAVKENSKSRELRRQLSADYSNLMEYIAVLAKAYPDQAEWNKLLTVVNVIRKRYKELIKHREGGKKDKKKEKE
ncbi:DUF6261 family protein [Limibacterium fermenti]|uniref:DUF6261 family protein n=1 Tax=Limibacterium fermenti TaxID=3229863 RepID=UPI000E8B8C27|nr:hypothetical protein [Porphyromonadaceae bacterium]HBX44532.1 hypothetical protein [Porphyromonadaceae bacterium]